MKQRYWRPLKLGQRQNRHLAFLNRHVRVLLLNLNRNLNDSSTSYSKSADQPLEKSVLTTLSSLKVGGASTYVFTQPNTSTEISVVLYPLFYRFSRRRIRGISPFALQIVGGTQHVGSCEYVRSASAPASVVVMCSTTLSPGSSETMPSATEAFASTLSAMQNRSRT